MDSEGFDSLDDFLTTPTDGGVKRSFKPKGKARPRPKSRAATGNHVNPAPPVLEPVQESLTDLTPPSDFNSVFEANEQQIRESVYQGDLVSTGTLNGSPKAVTTDDGGSRDAFFEDLHVNGVEGCQVSVAEQYSDAAEPTSSQWNPFDDIDLGQHTSTVNDGRKFRPKLKSFHVKKTVTSPKTDMAWVAKENNVSDGSYSISVHGHIDMLDDSLEGGLPLDGTSRMEMENSSYAVDLDVQFDVGTNGYTQSVNVPDKPLNSSIVMLEDGNPPFSSVDRESNNCDFSHGLAIVGVTGDHLGIEDRDPTTFEPSNIDCGRTEPESRYDSETARTGALLPDGDMHVEVAEEISADMVDNSAPADCTGVKKPLRVPRKRKARCAQPKEVVDMGTDGLPVELGSESATGRDVSNDKNEGDTNLKKKVVKRSRKSNPNNVKQTKSREKVNDTSSEQLEKPKKKFSHSTRARRKRVDPTFLATPDDEIDHTSVPLRDLILRAEYLEHESKKAPALPSTPVPEVTTERTEYPYNFETYSDWNTYPEPNQQEEQYESDLVVQESSSNFNYHTHMKKTHRVAWSKSDTETFYQGIRQFGIDFTLIAQLFPGRLTRNQIKMKYKKEERQNPKRITEAIENRADGTSFFQQVIKQLTEDEAKKNKELSDFLKEVGANEDNDQEATFEDTDFTGLEENDAEVKYDDPESIYTTNGFQESEKMD